MTSCFCSAFALKLLLNVLLVLCLCVCRYGSWGVCFTYGTWFGITALAAAGSTLDNDPALYRAVQFLVSKQRLDGGWGESYLSCQDKVGGGGGQGVQPRTERMARKVEGLVLLVRNLINARVAQEAMITRMEYMSLKDMPDGSKGDMES